MIYAEMKLTFPLLNTTINVPLDEATAPVNNKKTRPYRRKRVDDKTNESLGISGQSEDIVPEIRTDEKSQESAGEAAPAADSTGGQSVLMVEVVNVTHEKFRQTEEIKVTRIN